MHAVAAVDRTVPFGFEGDIGQRFAGYANHGAHRRSFRKARAGAAQDSAIMASTGCVLQLLITEEVLFFFAEQKAGIAIFASYIFVCCIW